MHFSAHDASETHEIKALFARTFTDSANEVEGRIVAELAEDLLITTNDNDLFVFVAHNDEGKLAGSIIFSRLTFASAIEAFLLSPVAIDTPFQGCGTGQALINFGLDVLKNHDVELVFTYGDPDFYSRVGFCAVSETDVQAPLPLSHPQGWLGQSLVGQAMPSACGQCRCVAALNKPEIW